MRHKINPQRTLVQKLENLLRKMEVNDISWANLHILPLGIQGLYLLEPRLVRALLQLGSILPCSLNIQGAGAAILGLIDA